jgi:hypothetical protein
MFLAVKARGDLRNLVIGDYELLIETNGSVLVPTGCCDMNADRSAGFLERTSGSWRWQFAPGATSKQPNLRSTSGRGWQTFRMDPLREGFGTHVRGLRLV